MQNAFLTFVNQHGLAQQRGLLAVSGGLDSRVLVELAHRAGLAFGIAHCNFGLRELESDGDEAFVRQLAESHQVPFFSVRFETRQFAQREGLSIQLAARKLRYAWFNEIQQTHSFDYLATAHHRNDALETLLLNLTRGTGLAGLSAIPAVNGAIFRPMLNITRTEIEAFARENSLNWREDRSNQTDDYPRNVVRHHVVPLLESLNPNLLHTVGQTLDQLAAARRLLEFHAKQVSQQALSVEHEVQRLQLAPLLQSPEPLLILHELLRPFGFSYQQSQPILAAFDSQAGTTFHSATHTLTKDRAAFLITKQKPDPLQEIIKIDRCATEMTTSDLRLLFGEMAKRPFEKNPSVALLDADKLIFPLTLRRWQPGDFFCPLGLGGKRKKVSDLLVDLKIPRPLKNKVWVLLSGKDIAWVIGHRVDERFRATDQSQSLWRAELRTA